MPKPIHARSMRGPVVRALRRAYPPCATGMLGVLLAFPARGEGEQSDFHTTVSASRLFSVQGANRQATIELARWAESASVRLDRLLDPRALAAVPRSCEIILAPGRSGAGLVVTQLVTSAGKLIQRVTVSDPAHLDLEDLLEEICRLRVDFMVAAQRPGAGRAPAWLGVGLAENLIPALRVRNARLLEDLGSVAPAPPLDQVLGWRHLPAGRTMEKVYCGLVVAWLMAQPSPAEIFREIIRHFAAQDALAMDDMARYCAAGSADDLERRWRAWLARQDRILRLGGENATALLGKLQKRLVIPPAELQAAGATNVAEALTAGELMVFKKQGWARDCARRQAEAMRLIAIGKDQEFRAVTEAFAVYYDALAADRAGWIVKRRLRQAETALRDHELRVRSRTAYLDAMERLFDPAENWSPDDEEHLVEKSAINAYIDGAERRLEHVPSPVRP